MIGYLVKCMTAHMSSLCHMLQQVHRLEKLQKRLTIKVIGNISMNMKVAHNKEMISAHDDRFEVFSKISKKGTCSNWMSCGVGWPVNNNQPHSK